MSITKNASLMTMASVGQKLISFVYFTIVARNIGAEAMGRYFFALSFTTVFVVFVDLGLTNVLVREAAKAKEKMQNYFSTVLSVKFLLGVLSYLAAVVVINLLGYQTETKNLVYLSAVTMLFDSVHLTMYGVLRAVGDLRYEAVSIMATQFITMVMGTIFLFLGFPLIFLIIAFTVPSFLNVCFASFILVKKYQIRIVPKYDPVVFKYLGKIAIPFALAAVFARVYSYIDSILLSKMLGDIVVGWYSIAYKITFAFQFVPLAIVAAIYPRFSEYFSNNKEKLAFIFEQSVKYLLVMVFPIVVGIGILAHDIILTLYTAEYLSSVLPLQVLLVGLVFSYISFPIGAFLNACNKQVTQTAIVGVVLGVNIILNVTLIPVYGIVGAAVAALVGNALLAILGYFVIPSVVAIHHGFFVKTIFQLLISSGVMGVLVWYINQTNHFGVAILVGIFVYPAMLYLTRVVTKKQLAEVWLLVSR